MNNKNIMKIISVLLLSSILFSSLIIYNIPIGKSNGEYTEWIVSYSEINSGWSTTFINNGSYKITFDVSLGIYLLPCLFSVVSKDAIGYTYTDGQNAPSSFRTYRQSASYPSTSMELYRLRDEFGSSVWYDYRSGLTAWQIYHSYDNLTVYDNNHYIYNGTWIDSDDYYGDVGNFTYITLFKHSYTHPVSYFNSGSVIIRLWDLSGEPEPPEPPTISDFEYPYMYALMDTDYMYYNISFYFKNGGVSYPIFSYNGEYTNYNYQDYVMAFDSNKVIHAIFSVGSDIFYSNSSDYGVTWTEEQNLTLGMSVREPSLHITNDNILHLFFMNDIDGNLTHCIINNGAISFTENLPQMGDQQSYYSSCVTPDRTLYFIYSTVIEGICDLYYTYKTYSGSWDEGILIESNLGSYYFTSYSSSYFTEDSNVWIAYTHSDGTLSVVCINEDSIIEPIENIAQIVAQLTSSLIVSNETDGEIVKLSYTKYDEGYTHTINYYVENNGTGWGLHEIISEADLEWVKIVYYMNETYGFALNYTDSPEPYNDYEVFICVKNSWEVGSDNEFIYNLFPFYDVWDYGLPIINKTLNYYNITFDNSIGGEDAEFSIDWGAMNCELGMYLFSWNGSGSWQNDTWIPFTETDYETVTVIKTLPLSGVVGFKWYANATEEMENQTDINYVIITFIKPSLINITIFGLDDLDDFIYMGEVYEIDSYWNYTDYCYLEMNDTVHIWKYWFDNSTKKMGVNVTDFNGVKTNELIIGVTYSEYSLNGNILRLKWRFILNKHIIDCFNRTLIWYAEYIDLINNITINDYGDAYYDIKIYNLGGYISYFFNGDGEKVFGGESYELQVTSINSYAYAESIFRKLQHIHILIDYNFNASWSGLENKWEDYINGSSIYIGMSYRYNGTWIQGWGAVVTIVDGDIGHHFSSEDKAWVKLEVLWFTGDGVIKTDYIYSFSNGYFPEGSGANTTDIELIFDLWFNKMNSSTVIGGRLTPLSLGMTESGIGLFANWYPMIGTNKISAFFTDLTDESGNTISCERIELVKMWVAIEKHDYDEITHKFLPFKIMEFKQSGDRMDGVNTPIYIEPKIPELTTGGGFLAPLYSAITGLGNIIWSGMLGASKIFIGAIDSFLSFLGLPQGTFSSLINMINQGFTTLFGWLNYIVVQVTNMLNMIGQMLNFITMILGYVIGSIEWIFTNVIGFPLLVLEFFLAIYNGEVYTVGQLTIDFTVVKPIIDAGRTVLPYTIGFLFLIWLVKGKVNLDASDDVEGIPKRLLQMFGYLREAYQNIFWIYIHIKNEIISIYNFIRSHIPTIGGGGGESSEAGGATG